MAGTEQVRVPGTARPVTIFTPKGPPAAYKTYQVTAPLSTHWRPATCEEVGCRAYANGWVTTVPANSELEHTLRSSGRRWSATWRNPEGTVSYQFPPGTRCFAASGHRVRVREESIYLVRDGDIRGNPRGTRPRRHVNVGNFLDDWANHQDKIADELRRG
jgi:hypothetical protein